MKLQLLITAAKFGYRSDEKTYNLFEIICQKFYYNGKILIFKR